MNLFPTNSVLLQVKVQLPWIKITKERKPTFNKNFLDWESKYLLLFTYLFKLLINIYSGG